MSGASEAGAGIAVLIWLFLIVLFGAGWVQNIYKLTECDFEAPYKTEIIRTVSIVPIIGAVTGWMDIGEEVGKPKK